MERPRRRRRTEALRRLVREHELSPGDLIQPVFVVHGFTMLTNPQMRRTVARVVSIERACRRMDVDTDAFLAELNRQIPTQPDRRRDLPLVPLESLVLPSSPR